MSRPSLSVILLDFDGQATAETELPPDTTITLSRRLARAGLYPAIDPEGTEARYPDERHARTADSVRTLLARYRAINPELAFTGSDEHGDWAETAQQVHRHLTQPFHTTEPFTAEPGLSTSIEETIVTIRAALDQRGPPSK